MITEDSPIASPQIENDNIDQDPDWLNTPIRMKQKKVSVKKVNLLNISCSIIKILNFMKLIVK